MVGRARDAALADLGAVPRGDDDVHETDLGELGEHPPRLISQPGLATELSQGLPQDVRQKADQNVRQNPLLFLVPDRTEAQIRFVDPEGSFGLGGTDREKRASFDRAESAT